MRPLRAALVTPMSGPLGGYGRAGAAALRLWAEWSSAELEVYDASPDPAAALRVAEGRRPDVLLGPYGSGPAAIVVEAATRLVWNHGGARVPPSPRVVTVLAPARTYWEGAVRLIAQADPGVRRVEVWHGPTGFGQAVGAGAAATARGLGLAVSVRTLPAPRAPLERFGAGSDAPPARSRPRPPDPATEALLLVAGGFTEEQDAAARLLDRPWRAAGFVGAGVEEVLVGLGPAREGLLGPAQWLPSAAPEPDEGPPASVFAAAYRSATGAPAPYPAAQAFAAGVLAARCVRDAATVAEDDVRAAAAALDCTTLFARFRLDPISGEQTGHRVLTVQWQHGVRRVVWPPAWAQAPLRPLRP